jgi:F-type H+-transporting ATPase subunit a
MEISIAAEKIGTLFDSTIPVTNSLLVTWIVMIGILLLGLFIRFGLNIIPSPVQNFMEVLYDFAYNFIEGIMGKHTPGVFPYAISFFFFIAVGNLVGLLPGMGSIMINVVKNG